jgi:hypothetical protein
MSFHTVALVLLQVERQIPETLGAGALAFMIVSMGLVTLLTVWCFTRILSGRKHFDPDGTGPQHAPVPGEVEKRRRKK